MGEIFSDLRHGDEFEDKEDRRVTILAVEEDPEEICPEAVRTRPSERFKVKVACDSPGSVAINIGDVSDPKRPTWRAFKWIRSPAASDCEFRAASSRERAVRRAPSVPARAARPRRPGRARPTCRATATLNAGLGWLFAAGGKFSVKLDGAVRARRTAARTAGELPGWLLPAGPVFCGEVPAPKRGTGLRRRGRDLHRAPSGSRRPSGSAR